MSAPKPPPPVAEIDPAERALRGLEQRYGARARLESNGERPISKLRLDLSPKGLWLKLNDASLVDTATGREVLEGAQRIEFSDDERWARVEVGGRVAVRDIARGETILVVRKREEALFGSGSRRVVVRDYSEGRSLAIVDLERRRNLELPEDLARAGKTYPQAYAELELAESDRVVAWYDGASFRLADLDTKRAASFALPGEVVFRTDLGAYATVSAKDTLVLVRLSDFEEVLRTKADKVLLEGDTAAVLAGGKLTVHDLARSTARSVAVRRPPCGPWQWESLTKGVLTAESCAYPTMDALTIDVGTGRSNYVSDRYGRDGCPDDEYEDRERCKIAGGLECDTMYGACSSGARLDAGMLIMFPDGMSLVDPQTLAVKVRFAESEQLDVASSRAIERSKRHIAATDRRGRTRLWNIETGAVVWRGPALAEEVTGASFAPNGDVLTTTGNGIVRRYHPDGMLAQTWRAPDCRWARTVVAGGPTPFVLCNGTLVEIGTGKKIAEHVNSPDPIGRSFMTSSSSSVTIEPVPGAPAIASQPITFGMMERPYHAGDWLANGGNYNGVWNIKTGAQLGSSPTFVGGTWVTPDGSLAVLGVADGAIGFALDGSGTKTRLSGTRLGLYGPLVADRAGVIAKGEALDEVVVWRWDAPAAPKTFASARPPLAISADGSRVALGGAGLEIRTWPGAELLQTLLPVPDEDAAIAIGTDAIVIYGDADAALALARCTVGPQRLPAEACLGRFRAIEKK